MNVRHSTYSTRSTVLRIIGGIAALAVLIAVGIGWMFASGTFKKATADFRGGVAATEQIHANGAYRIAQYDHFFDLCAAIQGKDAQLDALKTELKTATGQRAEIVAASITGVTGARNGQIAQYNGDASKADTAANFLSSSLPYKLDPTQEHISCA